MICLQETKFQCFGGKKARDIWGHKNWEWVHKEALNQSGGILIAWSKDLVEVEEIKMGEFSVSIKCKSVEDSFRWMFFGVYGPNSTDRRGQMWEELEEVNVEWQCPWVIGGDFNIVRYPFEKSGNHWLSS